MNNYIQLKSEAPGATYKKFRVLHPWQPHIPETGQVRTRPSGSAYKFIGPQVRTWNGMLKVKFTEDTGYGTHDDLKALFSSQTAAGNKLIMTDHYGDVYNVFSTIGFLPESQVPSTDLSGSFYYIPIGFISR